MKKTPTAMRMTTQTTTLRKTTSSTSRHRGPQNTPRIQRCHVTRKMGVASKRTPLLATVRPPISTAARMALNCRGANREAPVRRASARVGLQACCRRCQAPVSRPKTCRWVGAEEDPVTPPSSRSKRRKRVSDWNAAETTTATHKPTPSHRRGTRPCRREVVMPPLLRSTRVIT